MNATVREWIAKADGDHRMAGRELRARKQPNHDGICFHAQQCAEKLMKALLIQKGLVPPKVHDLVGLSRLVSQACSGWDWPIEELRFLTHAAVTFRYPGEAATAADAAKAFEIATRLRAKLMRLLPKGGAAE